MSTIESGDPTGLATKAWAPSAITSSTDATPIVLQVIAHGYADNEIVDVDGHATNTNANGTWPILTVDADHFVLVGSTATGAGAGGATGVTRDVSISPLATLPSDLVDDCDAANMMAPVELTLDRSTWANMRLGKYHERGPYVAGADDDTYSAWSTNAADANAAWHVIAGAPAYTHIGNANYNNLVKKSDRLLISISFTAEVTATSPVPVAVGLAIAGGGAFKVLNSGYRIPVSYKGPVVLRGVYDIPSGAVGQSWELYVMMQGNAGAPNTMTLKGDYQAIVNHLRPN